MSPGARAKLVLVGTADVALTVAAIVALDTQPRLLDLNSILSTPGPASCRRRDVEFAPVSLGEGREGGLPTGERGRDLVGHALAPSRLTSWTIHVLPSGSWNDMNVA